MVAPAPPAAGATPAQTAEVQRVKDAADKAAAGKSAADQTPSEQAIRIANTFRVPSAGTAQLSTAAGSIALTPGSTGTLASAFRDGIQALKAAGPEILSRATGVGFGALVYTRTLGNSDLYHPTPSQTILTIPANDLMLDLATNLTVDLLALAAASGVLDVPYRIYGDSMWYSVIATQASGGISPKVPVRAMTLDAALNAYTYITADTPPRTLVFPIAKPGDSSTVSPAKPVDVPVYTGLTLTPIKVKAEPLPEADKLNIRDSILVYPADSGLPPIYAVFSSPYGETNAKGKYSGRNFNTNKAGGPIQDLDWKGASIDQAGIDKVKLHTGRFGESPDNKVMIERLEKIFKGELQASDIDKRFYTHEIRELERYRNLGIKDSEIPENRAEVWNNTHTATLEDYKINEKDQPLYTSEAEDAYYTTENL
ncbi:S-type pyocin domain-containing protein [Pseudomonas yamanorum]|uniref:S-type pyocin domain-containing protein n=1 Tax=Pseudomonas yamanorum TaxID=515393 RepID=UPI002ED5E58D|nr:S-type pyocin domain-containing protein [Pseudomonas yamanorum]